MAEKSEGDGGCSSSSMAVNISRDEARRLLRKRQLKRLEKKLELYQRKIKETMEQEVTLDEMNTDTSAYLKEDMLKRKFMTTWYEICDQKHLSYDIQIDSPDSSDYSSTPYPEINRRINRLLKLDEFPDYWDISQLIDRVNEKHSLGIKDKERTTLSRKVFKEVGERIKRSRENSWREIFGCHLTDNMEEDPASKEPRLQETLSQSAQEGQKKLEDLFEEYVSRQERDGGDTSSDSDSLSEKGEESKSKKVKQDDDELEETTHNGDTESTHLFGIKENSDSVDDRPTDGDDATTPTGNNEASSDSSLVIVELSDTECLSKASDDEDIIVISD